MVSYGPGGSTCADHDDSRLPDIPVGLGYSHEGSDAIGVVSLQFAVLDYDGVHGPYPQGCRVDPVEVLHDGELVGDGDAPPGEIGSPEFRGDEGAQLLRGH